MLAWTFKFFQELALVSPPLILLSRNQQHESSGYLKVVNRMAMNGDTVPSAVNVWKKWCGWMVVR